MEACNSYYYATRDPLGTGGDFTTAPEIHQMFGELIGAALADVWSRAGKPGNAVYAELGPGRGTLASDALRVLRRAGFEGSVHLVETSPTLREGQSKLLPDATFHESLDTLPAEPLLLAANEFFDALPVRQFVDGRERHVVHRGEARKGSMRRTILVTLVTLTAISPIAIAQSRFTVVPSLSIGGVYDDNLFAEVESDAGKMLQVRPSFEGNYQSPRLALVSLYSQDML